MREFPTNERAAFETADVSQYRPKGAAQRRGRRPVSGRGLHLRVLLCLLTVAGPALLSAQVTTTGNIRVVATDESGLPVPGATVTAAAEDAATTRIGFTDAAGLVELRALSPSADYVVSVELAGFRTSRQADVLVRAGQTVSLAVRLAVGNVTQTVVVTAAPPLVDVTSAVVAEDITLDLTEAVPTGRSYQSYLQLVPGVLPDDPEAAGNPASKSGLNYRDIGGDAGVSRDNFYYIDGINVTDGVTGTFGANLNTEIIQEQQVLTGGIPAEYVGAPGLLSSVVTKSGANQVGGFAGSFSDTRFDPSNSSDYSGFVRAIDALPDPAAFYALHDLDGDGVISQDDLYASLAYGSTAGNPHGAVNYDRMIQSALGVQQTRSSGLS